MNFNGLTRTFSITRRPFAMPKRLGLSHITAASLVVLVCWQRWRFLCFVPSPGPSVSRRQSIRLSAASLGMGCLRDAHAASCEACCLKDWCACDHRVCDCQQILESNGFTVPQDASALGSSNDVEAWRKLRWRSANVPRFYPVSQEDIMVRNSTLKGAGQGVIARRNLPKGSVLPPYMGRLLTYREVGLREFNEGMEYTWCPLKNGAAMLNMTPQELLTGPQAADMAFCVDSRDFADATENPGRYVNGAKSRGQCELVNVKMCELGRVMYFRTTKAVAAGTELITNYGGDYWDFEGCGFVPAW
ncbi:unnamed protein product [Symbiodinium natans]|uniref:SET domain-containing protein n=1 Tax=Symbiodinium natans TaxID=878477 RepID=A0A812TYT3_9DINO|nr:unnamed protein product [Symbiodinium natans]